MIMTKQEAIERLREFFPRGSTVYTVLRHRSRSGMQRTIGVVSINSKVETLVNLSRDKVYNAPSIYHPNGAVSQACGFPVAERRDGVKVRACGMDMGFHVAYSIAEACYGDGYALRHEWI